MLDYLALSIDSVHGDEDYQECVCHKDICTCYEDELQENLAYEQLQENLAYEQLQENLAYEQLQEF